MKGLRLIAFSTEPELGKEKDVDPMNY